MQLPDQLVEWAEPACFRSAWEWRADVLLAQYIAISRASLGDAAQCSREASLAANLQLVSKRNQVSWCRRIDAPLTPQN